MMCHTTKLKMAGKYEQVDAMPITRQSSDIDVNMKKEDTYYPWATS